MSLATIVSRKALHAHRMAKDMVEDAQIDGLTQRNIDQARQARKKNKEGRHRTKEEVVRLLTIIQK
jgi:hypothetical protein